MKKYLLILLLLCLVSCDDEPIQEDIFNLDNFTGSWFFVEGKGFYSGNTYDIDTEGHQLYIYDSGDGSLFFDDYALGALVHTSNDTISFQNTDHIMHIQSDTLHINSINIPDVQVNYKLIR